MTAKYLELHNAKLAEMDKVFREKGTKSESLVNGPRTFYTIGKAVMEIGKLTHCFWVDGYAFTPFQVETFLRNQKVIG